MTITFHSSDDLVQRLRGGSRPIVFLVGSALTMPATRGGPGVCNVDAILDLVRARVASPRGTGFAAKTAAKQASRVLEEALARARDGGARYQAAFDQLKALVGADAMNAVIREAVLKARAVPTAVSLDDTGALAQLERSADGWHLGPGVKALGLLVAGDHDRFGRVVLTTNFDPLIEVAIRAAGGQAQAIEQLGDGTLVRADPTVTSVVHLHGLWRSDTWHTHGALTVDRAALRSSLARLYEEVTLVVLAYGGWDDVLTRTLAELVADTGARPDVIWCFYEKDPAKLREHNAHLLDLFTRFGERVACFAGIDCNVVLPRLRAAVDGEGELLGRERVCDELYEALDGDHAVEILGEPHMKRSRLLRWIHKEAAAADAQVAMISARELYDASPTSLLRRIADTVGRYVEMDRELHREHSIPTPADAIRALSLLRGVWILIDDADLLARPDHGFTEAFFGELRARVQAREIRWISVSRTRLGPLFHGNGLTSPFLNDACQVYAGALDPRIVERALSARIGARASAAMALTGTLPRLVYRLCDAEDREVDLTIHDLPRWAEGICAIWWQRDPAEQQLLKKIAAGATDLTSRERSDAADLCNRGLLVEAASGYGLNGKIWEDYVRSRP